MKLIALLLSFIAYVLIRLWWETRPGRYYTDFDPVERGGTERKEP